MQEYKALKKRCWGQDGNLLQCFCLVAVSLVEENLYTLLHFYVGVCVCVCDLSTKNQPVIYIYDTSSRSHVDF